MIATQQLIVGERLCGDVRPGQTMLDVATGEREHGARRARRGGEVRASIFVPAWLDRRRGRAAAQRLRIMFQAGGAGNIPLPDAFFEIGLSTFGAMFAPDQARAARELLRACRPGGKIGMANWARRIHRKDGPIGRQIRASTPRAEAARRGGAPNLGFVSSSAARDRSIAVPRPLVEGPTHVLWPDDQGLRGPGSCRARGLVGEMLDLVRRFNRSGDGTVVVSSNYLEAAAVRK
jgi:SAM-dependent methyltransferase